MSAMLNAGMKWYKALGYHIFIWQSNEEVEPERYDTVYYAQFLELKMSVYGYGTTPQKAIDSLIEELPMWASASVTKNMPAKAKIQEPAEFIAGLLDTQSLKDELLERASWLVGNPGMNISSGCDLAAESWQNDYAELEAKLKQFNTETKTN